MSLTNTCNEISQNVIVVSTNSRKYTKTHTLKPR